LTFEAEFVDAEYIDTEYAKYMNAAGSRKTGRQEWAFWAALAVLALFIYTAAYMFQAHRAAPAAPANLDLHDCTLPDVKVDIANPGKGEHDIVAPYAHSVCREGDVRLWESTH
jgi:hypothetical protein